MGNDRTLNPNFPASEYAQRWRDLLHSPRFRELLERHGYRVFFYPHPNVHPYLRWFDPPSHIEVMRDHGGSIQELFRRASVLVTDYSSVAFEMAYLRKPTVYYQFDAETVFSGTHTYRKGYFEYERDGFGPVACEQAELLESLGPILERGGKASAEHLARMERTFAFRDGQCSRRVFEAIADLDRAESNRAPSARDVVRAARAASRHGSWAIAEARWERVLELPGSAQPADSIRELAKAKRRLGKSGEAECLLHQPYGPSFAGDGREERAEVASASGDWSVAAPLWAAAVETLEGTKRSIRPTDTSCTSAADLLAAPPARVSRRRRA